MNFSGPKYYPIAVNYCNNILLWCELWGIISRQRPPKIVFQRPHKYLERLKSLSGYRKMELMSDRSKSLRFNPINWEKTTEPEGFTHLNSQLRGLSAHEFAISVSKHGRVHGFFLESIFYVCWLDPEHELFK